MEGRKETRNNMMDEVRKKFKNRYTGVHVKLGSKKIYIKKLYIKKDKCHNFDVKEWTLYKRNSSYDLINISDYYTRFSLLITVRNRHSTYKGENCTYVYTCQIFIPVQLPGGGVMPVGWAISVVSFKCFLGVFKKLKNGEFFY